MKCTKCLGGGGRGGGTLNRLTFCVIVLKSCVGFLHTESEFLKHFNNLMTFCDLMLECSDAVSSWYFLSGQKRHMA